MGKRPRKTPAPGKAPRPRKAAAKGKLTRPQKAAAKGKAPRPRKAAAGRKSPAPGRQRRAAGPDEAPQSDFIVVGVGASAGGLTALRALFNALPEPANRLALVIIQHLDPAHTSTLAELLAPHTSLRVITAEDGMEIAPGTAYVIAPGVFLTAENGKLRTEKPEQPYVRLPIDHFLRTLASELHERAAGVILSGTGTDGSLGVRSIKEAGGLVVVQDPGEAEYDGMPRSVIATGAADLVLRAAEIPEALTQYADGLRFATPELAPATRYQIEDTLPDFIEILRTAQAHSFEFYKPAMLVRRIARRIGLHHLENPVDYLNLLRQDVNEQDALFRDCLINVTAFFRDPPAFAYLAEEVIPRIIKAHGKRTPIRVWVPGCSTGEEAYSIGMLFLEALGASGAAVPLQIFATDVDLDALDVARRGIYPDSIAGDVSPERLERFFTREDHSYMVLPQLRECIVFAAQNVLTDAPFSNLDLVSCRNLLIYLLSEVQDHVLQLLHFGLVPDGFLFLGPSETVSGDRSHIEPESQKFRVYRRVGRSRPLPSTIPLKPIEFARHAATAPASTGLRRHENLFDVGQRALLESYAPASVLVDQRNEALYYFGAVDRYLSVASGEASPLIFPMAREGLRAKLRTALHEAREANGHASVTGAFIRRDSDFVPVSIEVQPISDHDGELLLVSFIERPAAEEPPAGGEGRPPEEPAVIARLENELDSTRRELQATIGDLETSNEELKAANEETMSLNEEYQSTNEELETSKEELQSLNEELTTLNAQLRERFEAQKQLADDLSNLPSGTDIATLFLDRHLRIRFFTPAAKRLFAIIATDIGRPLGDLTRRFEDPGLLADCEAAIRELVPRTQDVADREGRWYVRRIGPYRTQDEKIEGVVITFADITEMRTSVREALASKVYAENIVDTIRHPLLVLDTKLRVVSASRSFFRTFHMATDAVVGRRIDAVRHGELNAPGLISLLEALPRGGPAFEDFEFELVLTPYGRRTLLANARGIQDDDGNDGLILLALEDVTERKRAVAELFQELLDVSPDAVVVIDPAGIIEHASAAAESLFGYPAGSLTGTPLEKLIPSRFHARHRRHLREFFANPTARLIGAENGSHIFGRTRDGREIPVQVSIGAIPGAAHPQAVAAVRDISAQSDAMKAIEEARAKAEESSRLRSQFLSRISDDLGRFTQVVGMLTGILSRSANGPNAGEIIDRLGLVSGAMTDVVNAVSDIDRLEAGTVEPRLVDFRVWNALERMQTEFGHIARARQLEFRVVPSSLTIHSDPLLFDRIWQNLVSNALNYTTEGKVLVGCRRHGDRVRVEVWDTGRGIAAEQLDAIFDPYVRLEEESDGDSRKGLGLGLYLVRRLAGLLGLGIDVRSTPGRGSVFSVEAPLGGPVAEPPRPAILPAGEPPGRVGILVLGIGSMELSVFEDLLRLEGYEVWAASEARQALALVEAHAGFPALIVAEEELDDGCSALEVIRTIRERRNSGMPAIVMVESTAGMQVQACEDMDCGVLLRPVKPDDIIAHIARRLRRAGVAPPGNGGAAELAGENRAREIVYLVIGNGTRRAAMANRLSEVGHRIQLYENAEQFLSAYDGTQTGCVIAEIGLAGMSGVELLQSLHSQGLSLPVVLVADRQSIRQAVTGIEAGAVGLLEAPVDHDRLLEAVETALERGRETAGESSVRQAALERLGRLTAREREITSLLVAGLTNKEIAAELSISPRTVENHRANIRDKTGIRSLAELVRLMTQLR